MPEIKQDLPVLELNDQAAWEHWLESNHQRQDGVWLKFAKKAAPVSTVNYGQALEVALCYGWIDGQISRFDEHFYLQRFTPRRRRSKWSQINRRKATELVAAGKMRPAGLAAVEAAKADGRWQAAYPAQSEATVPKDFQRALELHPRAQEFFATLTGSTRYAFLIRLHDVKGAGARAKRIEGYIALLSEGKTLG